MWFHAQLLQKKVWRGLILMHLSHTQEKSFDRFQQKVKPRPFKFLPLQQLNFSCIRYVLNLLVNNQLNSWLWHIIVTYHICRKQLRISLLIRESVFFAPMYKVLLGSYFTYWSYKCFNPYFLDQPVHIFVNGGKFSKQYVWIYEE